MYKGEETFGKFVVASGDSAITLELLKKTFDKMSFLVLIFIKRNNDFAIAARFNANRSSLSEDLCSQLVAIVSRICHNYFGFQIGDKVSRNSNIVDLPAG